MAASTMQLEDWLDDLCVRFIINLPEEDLSSVARICFQVEEAQWFYEDFIRPLDPSLPSMSLRTFCLRIFQHCPLLAHFSVENHTKAFEEFLEYKTRVPVRGAILMNPELDSIVLVKGWKKNASWTFPGGKINKDEDDLDCAVREVWEETGLDLQAAGLIPSSRKPKYIELPIRDHQVRLYVFRDIPMNTHFQPQTRKEISKIQWYKLSDLPAFRKKAGQPYGMASEPESIRANKFYMVAPFMVPLKKWVGSQRRMDEKKVAATHDMLHPQAVIEESTLQPQAWAPQPPKQPNATIPAIDTLDGATQELQRLLKMQPSTNTNSGLHPAAPSDDKGSALLSLLKAKSAVSAPAPAPAGTFHGQWSQVSTQIARPPYQQEPTTLVSGHSEMPASLPTFNLGYHHGGSGASLPLASHSPVALMHPQPLPPQVQRNVFNQSALQTQASHGQTYPTAHASQGQHHAARYQHQGGSNQAPVDGPAQTPALPPGVIKLNGQSRALLDVFKRGPSMDVSAQAASPSPRTQHQITQSLFSGEPRQASRIPVGHGHSREAGYAPSFEMHSQQQAPTELAGSGVGVSPHQHQEALLAIFKPSPGPASNLKSGATHNSEAIALQKHANAASQGQAHHLHGIESEDARSDNELISTRMRQVSIQSNMSQPMAISAIHDGAQALHESSQQTQPQPMRILSRGQSLHEPTFQPTVSSPSHSALLLHRHQHQQQHQPQSPSGHSNPTASAPSPHEAPRQVAQGSTQRLQLLSLFGKQEGPISRVPQPSENTIGIAHGVGSVGQAHNTVVNSGPSVPSPRAHSATMSQADQSFLLGYLQSVTTKASR